MIGLKLLRHRLGDQIDSARSVDAHRTLEAAVSAESLAVIFTGQGCGY
jgi:hypothetical protein